jgi:hypothetical protein
MIICRRELGSTKVSRCNDTCIPKVSTIVRIVLTLWINMATTVLCDDLLDDFLYSLLSLYACWFNTPEGVVIPVLYVLVYFPTDPNYLPHTNNTNGKPKVYLIFLIQ